MLRDLENSLDVKADEFKEFIQLCGVSRLNFGSHCFSFFSRRGFFKFCRTINSQTYSMISNFYSLKFYTQGTNESSLKMSAYLVQPFGQLKLYKYVYISDELYYINIVVSQSLCKYLYYTYTYILLYIYTLKRKKCYFFKYYT